MPRKTNKYDEYVEHPRYGRGPRITGLNPKDDLTLGVYLGWHSPESRIPDTAIIANTKLQDANRECARLVPVTHYFDAKRKCRDCSRMFIFFAEEQRYWYENLKFPLESDCVRCIDCRKNQHSIAELRSKYESLFAVENRTEKQNLEIANCALILVEQSVFGKQTIEKIRSFLNQIPDDSSIRKHATFRDLLNRLKSAGEQLSV